MRPSGPGPACSASPPRPTACSTSATPLSALINRDAGRGGRRHPAAAAGGHRPRALPGQLCGGHRRRPRLARRDLARAAAAPSPAASRPTGPRSTGSRRAASSTPASARAAACWRPAPPRRRADGRPRPVDPDGAPLYPGNLPRPARRRAGAPAGRRLAGGAAPRRREGRLAADPAPLAWWECGGGEGGDAPARDIAADPAAWGDALLARREVSTSYHLSVVVDDARAGRHGCRARPRPVPRHGAAPPAAAPAGPARAALPPPPPGARRGGPEAVRRAGARPSLRDLRGEGSTPADIRRRVGLPA